MTLRFTVTTIAYRLGLGAAMLGIGLYALGLIREAHPALRQGGFIVFVIGSAIATAAACIRRLW